MTPTQRRARDHFAAILRAVDRLAPRERRRIIAAMERVRAAVSLVDLERAIEIGGDTVTTRALGLGTLSIELRGAVLRALATATEIFGPMAAEQLAVLLDTRVNWPTYRSRAVKWARWRAAQLVVEISEQQRRMLREIIDVDKSRGVVAKEIARTVRDHIGLDSRFSAALRKFETDARAAVEAGKISAARARKKVETYRRRLLAYRAESITRTELIDAVGETDLGLWRDAARRGLIKDDDYAKEWIGILRDGRICQHCYGLHGQRRRLGEDFVAPDGESLRRPTKHTRCRCQLRLIKWDEPSESMPPFVEPKTGRGLRPML